MSLCNRFVLPIALFALAVLAGCGSSSPKVVPPPGGAFSNSSFNGTYVFSITGTDNAGAPISIAGSLSADGSGNVSGGTVDFNDAQAAPILGTAITGGTYNVGADGRATATLATSTPFGSSLVVDFVLSSTSHGLITEFDGNASGSGTVDLQSTVTQAQLAGSYAFSLSGIDPGGNLPFATLGSFTLDSNGNITSGVEDFDDQGFAYVAFGLSGTVVAQVTGAPYVATLTATNSSDVAVFGTLVFDVYPVDATHLKFVEADTQNGFTLLSGDAYTQTGASIPTTATTYVFTMGGGVTNSGPITVGGVLPIDGQGNIAGGAVDENISGTTTTTPLSFGGTYGPNGSTVGGRMLFSLTGFQVAGDFIVYPTANAGLLMIEMDGGGSGFLLGSALPQTSTTFAASQGYGMNLTGVNTNSEEDDIAEFTTTSTGFSGIVDFNDEGATTPNQSLTGTYTADTPPSGRYDFLSNGFNGELYAVDSSTALFVELDSNQVGIGTIQLQSAPTGQATASRLLVPSRVVLPRTAKQQNKAQWRRGVRVLRK
jgi:hypothetical protein